MKIFAIFLSFFQLIAPVSIYYSIFESDYKNALGFVRNNKNTIIQYCSKTAVDTSLVVSVIFPELIRYSYFMDFFETSALELLYTEYGSDATDFSIGRFQMRPSFIENIEKHINDNSGLKNKYGFINDFIGDSPSEIRTERIARLKMLKWELIYICCFADIIAGKFPDVQQMSKQEKIKFFASAYNHGFDISSNEIINWVDAKYFPYGQSTTGVQYSYCDVAYDFYEHYYYTIFN